MTDHSVDELRNALEGAKAHLKRCEDEYNRFEPPGGIDYRHQARRLRDELTRSVEDVAILERALYSAQHAHEAFETAETAA
jgi:hypothetical protein